MAFRDFLGRVGMRRRSSPQDWTGVTGTAIWSGYVDPKERNRKLADHDELHRTYSDLLTNTSIVAASVRYYLNLVGKAEWSFEPAEGDTSGEFADRLEEMLKDDLRTPWNRIARRAAMYRFYGFSVQEWKIRRRDDGVLTYDDIRPRPQATIKQWDVDPDGTVLGMIQESPQTGERFYIPRAKTLYLVDDALSDSPVGLGIFRHLVEPAETVRRFQQLEGVGFEVDLRNIPVGRAPLREIGDAVRGDGMSPAEADKLIDPIKSIVANHIRGKNLGVMLDSSTYEGEGDTTRPSQTRKFDLELLSGSQTSLPDMARAIDRLQREMARIMGTEQLLLGSSDKGSYALAQDKTGQFYLMIDGALTEITETVEEDLVKPVWEMNGWPEDMRPKVRTEAVRARDVNQIVDSIETLARAGAPIVPGDPVVAQVYDLLGLDAPLEPEDLMELMALMAGDTGGDGGNGPGPAPSDDPPMPEPDE